MITDQDNVEELLGYHNNNNVDWPVSVLSLTFHWFAACVSSYLPLHNSFLFPCASSLFNSISTYCHISHYPISILRTCCKDQDGVRPSPDWRRARGRPPSTWIHQICQDTGILVPDALELAENKSFWRHIATMGCYGWTLLVMMIMMMMMMNEHHLYVQRAYIYKLKVYYLLWVELSRWLKM